MRRIFIVGVIFFVSLAVLGACTQTPAPTPAPAPSPTPTPAPIITTAQPTHSQKQDMMKRAANFLVIFYLSSLEFYQK